MPTPTVSLFHNAYFYESNEFPENPIAEFLHEGLAAGENAVVVTSLGHISRIEDELNRLGVRLGPSSKKAWSVVDTSSAADALLSGHPVESVTGRFIAPAVRYARENSLTGRVRIYGDLADLMLGWTSQISRWLWNNTVTRSQATERRKSIADIRVSPFPTLLSLGTSQEFVFFTTGPTWISKTAPTGVSDWRRVLNGPARAMSCEGLSFSASCHCCPSKNI
jgi:hypothetical protein